MNPNESDYVKAINKRKIKEMRRDNEDAQKR